MTKTQQIFKVQLPLISTDPNAGILVYNEDRSIETIVPMDEDAKKYFTEPKSFHFGHMDKDGWLILVGEAPWQDW